MRVHGYALMKQNFRIHLHSFYAKKIAQMQVSLNTSIQRVEKKLSSLHLPQETQRDENQQYGIVYL